MENYTDTIMMKKDAKSEGGGCEKDRLSIIYLTYLIKSHCFNGRIISRSQ